MKFSDRELNTLRQAYDKLPVLHVARPEYKTIQNILSKLDKQALAQLKDSNIKWVSKLAAEKLNDSLKNESHTASHPNAALLDRIGDQLAKMEERGKEDTAEYKALDKKYKELEKKTNESITESKYTNQTGIKSSLLNNSEFSRLLNSKEYNWIRGANVKIFNQVNRGNFIFTDGKSEIVANLHRPVSIIKPLGRARDEVKQAFQQNESKQPIREIITKEQKFKIYHKLKKGSVINIKYRSMAGTTEVELTVVKDKALVGKSRSERITLTSKKGYKYYLYNRDGDISLAVGESAAQILDITESVNEIASRTAVEIGALTGANREFIQNFMDKHKLDPEKVYNFVKKGKYAERADFITAVAGRDGNPIQKKLIQQLKLKESTSAKSKINKIIIEEVRRLKFPWAYKNESHTASHPNAALLDRIGDKLAKMEERGKEDTAEYKALDKKYKELEKKTNESVNESFENPLEGFPQVYKNLLKKLQRSNDMGERYMLIQKMNVIRKKLKLKPLTSESVNEAKSTKKGDTYYVDTDFVNLSKKGGNLKHLGMGDFAVDVYGGKTISFHRVSEKIPGFSGRTHRVVGNGDDFKKLTKLMGIKSESVKSKLNSIIIEEVKRLKESKYPLYHTSFTSAADAARNLAMSQGYKVDEDDWQTEVALGGRNLRSRPSTGKTTKFTVGLSKNGKPEKNKKLSFQVYGLASGNYELNAYVA